MPRERTPPGLKWALNQRAALAGRAEKLGVKVQHFQSKLDAVQAEVEALDITISAMSSRVRPDALGTINAWQGRYGERGALKAFLEQQLRAAGKVGATTPELARAAQDTFGLVFETAVDWAAFRRCSVGNQLNQWKKRGLVRVNYQAGPTGKTARWRWAEDGPTLADLALAAKAAS